MKRIDGNGHALYSINLVARHLDISAETMRRWERDGKVFPAYTALGFRLYSEANIDTLREIIAERQKQRTLASSK